MTGSPIKAGDLRRCDICSRDLTEDRTGTFFRVTFERMFVDLQTWQIFCGGRPIAPNDKIAVPLSTPVELIICDHCAISRDDRVFYLAERAAECACARRIGI